MLLTKKLKTGIYFAMYLLYMIAFYIFYASNFQSLFDNAETIYRFSYYIIVLAMCILFIFSKMQMKNWVLSIFFVFVGFVSYRNANDNVILLTIFMIIGAQNIDFERFIKLDFFLRIFIFLLVSVSEKIGIIGSTVLYRSDGFVRDGFGFLQPNTAGALLLSIFLEYFVIRYKKINVFDYALGVGIMMFTLETTNSRSSVLGMFLGLILMLAFKGKTNFLLRSRVVGFFIKLLFPILALLSYFAVRFYNPMSRLWNILDQLFSGRLNLISYFVKNYPVKLLGQYIQLQDPMNLRNTYFLVMDNGYISMLLKYGVVILFVFCYFYISYSRNLLNAANFAYLIPVIIMSFVGLMENTLYSPAYNFTLILLISIAGIKSVESSNE
ncbi:hypothetical protein ACLHK8_03520 [Pediococcus sp. M21F004]|uniref:hypothetical protein n=1 Tax=Pediococcus sp. M21F004 TaxID=3390033 RepID=UPI003DA72714